MYYQNLVGLILPPLIDLINTHIEDSRIKFWVSMLICVVVGVVLNLDKLNNPQGLLGGIGMVFATAEITYHTYWRDSGTRVELQNKLV